MIEVNDSNYRCPKCDLPLIHWCISDIDGKLYDFTYCVGLDCLLRDGFIAFDHSTGEHIDIDLN